MRFRSIAFVSFTSAFLAVACGESEETPDGGTATFADADEGEEDATTFPDAERPDRGPDGGRPDTGRVDGGANDPNMDFDTAQTVELNSANGISGTIDPAADLDYFMVEIPADTWVIFDIEANPNGEPDLLDSVITIYNPARQQIAQNDDQLMANTLDSEVVYHVKEAGTYYVKVEDYSTFSMQEPEGGPLKDYVLSVFSGFNDEIITVETEAGDDVASAQMVGTNEGYGYVMGTYRDASDTDVYRFTVPTTALQNYTIDLMPTGTNAFGSTPTGLVWVTDTTGSTVSARANFTENYNALTPALRGGGTYLIHVQHPATAAGMNDFYVIKLNSYDENPAKIAEPTNNTVMGAEVVALEDEMPRAGYRGGSLTDGDVDYYSVDIRTGEQLAVYCSSGSGGSGVQGLTVQVTTSTGGIFSVTEAPPAVLALEATTSTGTTIIRLSKEGQDPEVIGNWYRCGFQAVIP